MQLGFLLQEIKGYAKVWEVLTTAKTVREASDAVLLKFERPADQSEAVQEKRAAYGHTYYDKYAASAPSEKDEKPTPATPTPTTYYRVRKSWEDKASQIGAFTVLQNAKNCVDANPGYAAFDDSGNKVYPVAAFTPYLVSVTVTDLNYRTGPGVENKSRGYIEPGVYTIVEEQNGWGKLKSGAGWIKLSYTTRIR